MKHHVLLLSILTLLAAFTGCSPEQSPKQTRSAPPPEPNSTVGSLAHILQTEPIQVRGIGIVAGLAGTGSSECPDNIRQELEKYIRRQVPGKNGINPRAFIESLDNAVVEVVGTIPSLSSKDFNLVVRPLSSTQTTSLDGGYLYTTELKELSRLARIEQFTQYSKTIATASGPIYCNKLDPARKNEWYVLGGGKSLQTPFVRLTLNKPDFLAANAIRNRINERFGPKTCVPNSEMECLLYFPVRYTNEKERFLNIVSSLLLTQNDRIRAAYVASAVERLAGDTDKTEAENILEGIGKPAIDKLRPLLTHPDESVRFHAARCMLNIGSNEPVQCLRTIIFNPASPYRLEAIRSIGVSANAKDAKPILMSVLAEEDQAVRLAAYELLAEMDSPAIMRKQIGGGDFMIDSVICGGPKMIYVYQQDKPRIVLFGSPIQCSKDLFVQSEDGTITINARAGDKYVLVARRHPGRPRVVGPIQSSFDLGILLQTLGEMPQINHQTGLRPGLAISYSEIVPLLKKMCSQQAVDATFVAGPAPDPETILQSSTVSGR